MVHIHLSNSHLTNSILSSGGERTCSAPNNSRKRAATASFIYDGDGRRVAQTVNGVTTYFVGNHYEKKGSQITKYYFAGATRIAVRTNGTLSYLLGDHLGSSSVTTDANGGFTASALYKAFGETRYTLGNLGTDYQFTGQRLQAKLGIYWFQSRWMDPSLGRFTSPDTIVPTGTQGTQAWDRYAFVNNNPVRYNDPTGHRIDSGCGTSSDEGCSLTQYQEDLDAQKLALLEAEVADTKCAAGDTNYCSGYAGFTPTALVLGASGSAGAVVQNTVGVEDVIMFDDGEADAFAYYGEGTGVGASESAYIGVVFNLHDMESYKGPFLTYTANVFGLSINYFHDATVAPLTPYSVQGFSIGGSGGFSVSGSTYTIYEEIPDFP